MKPIFTADPHWRHANIIKYCNRPFTDVDEMNRTLIDNWNSVVNYNQDIYVLGDIYLGHESGFMEIFKQLNGNIHFIAGNHDKTAWKFKDEFASFTPGIKEITVGKQRIVLCHYAMRVWNRSHRGSWHLYGHSHGTLPDDPNSLSIDVGVDCHNYTPITFDQVAAIMKRKAFKPIDHHA